MSDYHKRMTGSARQKRNRHILAASNVCHICGHPDSDAVDHVLALVRGGSDDDPANLKPAHHKPCPTCGHRCNLEKGDRAWAPIIRRSNSLDRP